MAVDVMQTDASFALGPAPLQEDSGVQNEVAECCKADFAEYCKLHCITCPAVGTHLRRNHKTAEDRQATQGACTRPSPRVAAQRSCAAKPEVGSCQQRPRF